MSDRLGATTESWRVQRRSGVSDMQIKRMAVIAVSVVAIGAIGATGYWRFARQPRAVPVIEADSRPVRVRPDNPGGMQVAGADEQIMGGAGSGRADAMAPPPEAPQLGALRAQIQAATQPVAPPVAPPPPAAAPSVAAPSVAAPFVAAASLTAPSLAAPPAAATPVAAAAPRQAAAPSLAGRTMVQLASVGTEQEATAEWRRLANRMPELLRSRQPALQRAERDGKQVWRVRTGGFADTAQATAFCTQVRATGSGCTIASF